MARFGPDYDRDYDHSYHPPYGFRERSHRARSGRELSANENAYGRAGGGRPDEGWGYGYSWGGPHHDDFRDRGYGPAPFIGRGYPRDAYGGEGYGPGPHLQRGYDQGAYGGGGYGPTPYLERGYDQGAFHGEGYDRGYKSDWQTAYGDPFGDRQRHTPMRVIRGEPRYPGDRGAPQRRRGAYDEHPMWSRTRSEPPDYDRQLYRPPAWRYPKDVF